MNDMDMEMEDDKEDQYVNEIYNVSVRQPGDWTFSTTSRHTHIHHTNVSSI